MKPRAILGIFSACIAIVFGQALHAQQTLRIPEAYSKTEVQIPMRDGIKLHTTIYAPRDDTKKYPFMLNRTPYNSTPYGKDQYAGRIGPSRTMEREGYIFVKQDVRGRWMSEGKYDNMRPHVEGDSAVDESSDTYDTIDWLLKNVPNNNGKAGMWGISYPGFYAAAALPEHHPALVAASPQAPIADFFFDDFHHHGAYLLGYWFATNTFGYQHDGPTSNQWYSTFPVETPQDAWQFYMSLGPLSNSAKYFGDNNFFWQQLSQHPNYDEFWQKRSILPHLKNIRTNVMTVGGWFDAEDLYGPLNIYREIEKNNPDAFNVIVMGPWSHGDWASTSPVQMVGNIEFGKNLSQDYQEKVEAPFFKRSLKGLGKLPDFEALVFDTGKKKWREFQKWPPENATTQNWFLLANHKLNAVPPAENDDAFSEFESDPANPVPYRKREDITVRFTPRPYMTDDQRFASENPGVLVFKSAPLKRDVTLAGDILAKLKVSTTGTSADWIVKLIDVYPDDEPNGPHTPQGIELAGFQQMVRSEVIRGRFRNSYSNPEPFVPDEITDVNLPLQDILHTFKKGHRVMVHVQSTWFPLIDRNPQKYVDNIFEATPEDFIKAKHRVYHSKANPSSIEIKVVE